jgi:mono/diheme cytochrome c family protein
MLRSLILCAALALSACNDDFLLKAETADDSVIEEVLALTPVIADGEASFTSRCSGCHNTDGSANIGPSLSEWIGTATDEETLTVIIEGINGMPSFRLEPQELADILGWMKDAFGGEPAQDPALTLTGDPATGATVFSDNCAVCHNSNGDPGPVGTSMRAWVSTNPKDSTLDALREGRPPAMPSFDSLEDQALADLLAWLYDTFGS